MRSTRYARKLLAPLLLVSVLVAVSAGDAQAESAPVKLVLNTDGFIGAELHQLKEACPDNEPAECQSGNESSQPGGFAYPTDVAATPNGDIYVADNVNERVQELNPAEPQGKQFVLMFGKGVNKLLEKPDICTKAEEKECKAGVRGAETGALNEPQDVTVEAATGDVYVLDHDNWRIDKYSAGGEFLLMFGKGVNKKGGNVCVKAEEQECQAGVQGSLERTEEASFDFVGAQGGLLAAGATSVHEHIIYVADAHRVQEFGPGGEWLGELKVPSAVISSIATSGETLFLVYNNQPTVFEFDAATNQETGRIAVQVSGSEPKIRAIATDAAGHLAVVAFGHTSKGNTQVGLLYETSDNRKLTSFTVPGDELYFGVAGITFASNGDLFSAIVNRHDVMSYTAKAVTEPVTLQVEPLSDCALGPEQETDVTYNCKLVGEVDAWGVGGTEAWLQWGRSEETLENETPMQSIENVHNPPVEGEKEPYVPIEFEVEHVRPNESSFFYRLVALDQNVKANELLEGETLSFTTPLAAPKVLGAGRTLFVRSNSAVLFGELNPEQDSTTYDFLYARSEGCEARERERGEAVSVSECPGVRETAPQKSAVYRRIGAAGEATGLAPSVSYRFELRAANGGGSATGAGGELTTVAAPVVQAETGGVGAVTATSATVAGSVDGDGQTATYVFELGVANGADTQYGVVASGMVDASPGFEPVSTQLAGLQPGTLYAYRVGIHLGDGAAPGSSAVGEAHTFETQGAAVVLEAPTSLPLLSVPSVPFPREKASKKEPRSKEQQLKNALTRCKKKPKRKRGPCEKQARNRYRVNSKKKSAKVPSKASKG